jgi:hypothetical protein
LVFDGELADFWQAPGEVDRPLYERFRAHLIASSQLNASFYAHRPALQPAAARAQEPHLGQLPAPAKGSAPAHLPRPVVVAWSSARSAATLRGDEGAARPNSTVVTMDGRPRVAPKASVAGEPREAHWLDA